MIAPLRRWHRWQAPAACALGLWVLGSALAARPTAFVVGMSDVPPPALDPVERPAGSLPLRYEVELEETGLCEPMKYFQWVGVPRVLPGDPESSGLLQRFVRDDSLRMPSTGTTVVDPSGTALLRDWIDGLASCP